MQRPSKLAVAHSDRFRKVSTLYPRVVAEAYRGHGGIRRAARDTDAQVAKMVAAWERYNGAPVRNWRAIGAAERPPVPRRRPG
jgi:hypothetical protein